MKARVIVKIGIVSVLFCLLGVMSLADPVVSNVRAQQRPGTGLVDIYYDLTGTVGQAAVSVAVSDDSGATYDVAVTSVSGDLGFGISFGTDRHIIWDALADVPGIRSNTMRVQLAATPFSDSVPMVFIPAGSFQLGDNLDGMSDAPVHTVALSAYKVGETEVTWAQWQAVRDWAVANGYTDLDGIGAGKGEDHPVHTVNWYDVVKWCNAASEKIGLEPVYYQSDGGAVYRTGEVSPFIDYTKNGYRLPTEAEWERAARGGLEGKRFPWGDTISHAEANYQARPNLYSYDVNSVEGFHPDYIEGDYPYTSPVRSFAANGLGLYDTAGNLWEWCGDWYLGSSYYGSSPSADPAGPESGWNRVMRGGEWNSLVNPCRVADRKSYRPTDRDNRIGFRVSRSQSLLRSASFGGQALQRSESYVGQSLVGSLSQTVMEAQSVAESADFSLNTVTWMVSGPGNQYAVIGGEAVFSVTHALNGAVTYQWQVSTDGGNQFEGFSDSAVVVGSQTAVLRISDVQAYLFGTLYRVVAEVNGSVYISEAGELLQAFVPSFTQQPVKSFDSEGMLISAAVMGPPEPVLQWQVSEDGVGAWTDLAESPTYVDVSSPSLRITVDDASMAPYRFRLKASNLAGEVLSDTVVIGTAPVFTEQPFSVSCVEGDEVFFSVVSNGFPVPVIRWEVSVDNGSTWTKLVNDAVYDGAESALLAISTDWDINGRHYRAVAVNAVGEVPSDSALLSVSHAPRFVRPPVAERVFAGRNVQFSAEVSANPSASYQWQISHEGSIFFNLVQDVIYSGVDGLQLGIAGATLDMEGYWYRLRVTNDFGTATSAAVPLTVRELQNYDTWLQANGIAEGERDLEARHGPLQLSNLEAYVFGLDPHSATSADLPHLVDAGEGMSFVYRRNIDVEDTTVFFESSADLTTWQQTEPLLESVLWVADGVEGRQAVFDWDGADVQFIRMFAFIDDLSMAPVPAGTLAMSMGTVAVDTFLIGRGEVTWGEWQRVQTYASANGYDLASSGAGCAANHPVHSVNWYDVVKWCNAKSEMGGLTPVYTLTGAVYRSGEDAGVVQDLKANGYRLPMEEEWEFAARGGNLTNGYTYAGSNDLNTVGWNWDNSTGAACDLDSGRGTWPVGGKAPNELGLYDMTGNVWEWCWGPNGALRPIRGGSWWFIPPYWTVSDSAIQWASSRHAWTGFRLARTPSP